MQTNFYLGIDFGTSGARAVAIDQTCEIQATASVRFDDAAAQNWLHTWKTALFDLIDRLPATVRRNLSAIAVNGTSATVLLCDAEGNPLTEPLLYDDARGAAVLEQVQAIAPPHHTVVSATSSLAKLLWWSRQAQWQDPQLQQSAHPFFLHQADWLAFLLHGHLGISDYHNALKLGYDVGELRYPIWMQPLPTVFQLPRVIAPGTAIAPITSAVAVRFDCPQSCLVCAGTTDSIAAFLASGVQAAGEAVTSLGSTLVLKLLSETRVDDARYGIYSHRLGDRWLVGGASNTGGAVLKQFFSDAELQTLSAQISLDRASPFDYYPLLKPGERFPINDPNLLPRLEPRPEHPVDFLHGLLESLARIEARGYQLLQELGATPLTRVYTAGGGAQNSVWMQMRSRYLQVPVVQSTQTEAAYGTAMLALQGTAHTKFNCDRDGCG
jgi:D-ribulokinase